MTKSLWVSCKSLPWYCRVPPQRIWSLIISLSLKTGWYLEISQGIIDLSLGKLTSAVHLFLLDFFWFHTLSSALVDCPFILFLGKQRSLSHLHVTLKSKPPNCHSNLAAHLDYENEVLLPVLSYSRFLSTPPPFITKELFTIISFPTT